MEGPMEKATGVAVDGLTPCKRYITTHDSNGKSVYAESPDQVFNVFPVGGGIARSYAIGSVPANLTDEADVKEYRAETGVASYLTRDIAPPQPGANLLVVDVPPGGGSHMHRTVSIDFSICVTGELEHTLDSGEKVRLFAGVRPARLLHKVKTALLTDEQDHIVQRGTMHKWFNPSKDKPARLIACTIPCAPFKIDGKEIVETHLPPEA